MLPDSSGPWSWAVTSNSASGPRSPGSDSAGHDGEDGGEDGDEDADDDGDEDGDEAGDMVMELVLTSKKALVAPGRGAVCAVKRADRTTSTVTCTMTHVKDRGAAGYHG